MGNFKSIAKQVLPDRVVSALRALRGPVYPPVPFDNTYEWLNYTFLDLLKDNSCASKPQYAWGVAQGAALAKVLEIPRISAIEFGVAGGHGLVILESIAEGVELRTGIGVDVIGFDSGVGLPKPQDLRDQPNMWFGGQLAMDKSKLEGALRRAKLYIGDVEETVTEFAASSPAPVAFISFDLDLYSSTRDAIALHDHDLHV